MKRRQQLFTRSNNIFKSFNFLDLHFVIDKLHWFWLFWKNEWTVVKENFLFYFIFSLVYQVDIEICLTQCFCKIVINSKRSQNLFKFNCYWTRWFFIYISSFSLCFFFILFISLILFCLLLIFLTFSVFTSLSFIYFILPVFNQRSFYDLNFIRFV